MRRTTISVFIGLASSLLLGVLGCEEVRQLEFGIPADGSNKWGELNPVTEMHDQPYTHAQKEGMLPFAPETVATSDSIYPPEALENPRVAATLVNPVPITRDSLLRGQDLYMTYCVVCHGDKGLGDGYVVPKFPRPPSLASTKMRRASDGEIYHIITNGQNIMPHYRGQLRPMERWAIVNYVRALQRSQYPEAKDLARVKTTN